MLTKLEIINKCKRLKRPIDSEELRSLPYKQAFIYGRVSTPGQIRDSKESIRELAVLVELAIADGYRTTLVPDHIREWVDGIGKGTTSKGIKEDGQVTVDVQDLGISGQLTAEDRKGMAHLQQGIISGKVGAVYVTEGVSRLSRDRDRILPYQLLKLMKDNQVRLRTPEGIWNPAIERDWDYLDKEFEHAIGELKIMSKRLQRRKTLKASRGEFVGEPIPLGFIVPIVGQKPNGQYEYSKYIPFPPHADIAKHLLNEYVRCNGSLIKTMRAIRGLVIPFFPPELSYMEHLSSLRRCKKLGEGYEISPNLIANLATNPKLIGVWRWGNNPTLIDSHPAAVPEELFAEAFEIANRKGKPKGRAASSDTLEWSGLLHCHNHLQPRRVTSHSVAGHYACDRDYKYAKGPGCLYIMGRFLDEPLSKAVLSQLELSPFIEGIISRLEAEAAEGQLSQVRDRQQVSVLEKRIKTLKTLLPCCVDEQTGIVDRKKEQHYWNEINQAEQELQDIADKPVSQTATRPDYSGVRSFLEKLPEKWSGFSRTSRNRFLKALIDKVELEGEINIRAIIHWKAGFCQQVIIHRHGIKRRAEKLWTDVEDRLLKQVFPCLPQEAVLEALTGRSWKSITLRAGRLGLKRKRVQHSVDEKSLRSNNKQNLTRESSGTHLKRIASGTRSVSWEIQSLEPHQESSSERRGEIFPSPSPYFPRPLRERIKVRGTNQLQYFSDISVSYYTASTGGTGVPPVSSSNPLSFQHSPCHSSKAGIQIALFLLSFPASGGESIRPITHLSFQEHRRRSRCLLFNRKTA